MRECLAQLPADLAIDTVPLAQKSYQLDILLLSPRDNGSWVSFPIPMGLPIP